MYDATFLQQCGIEVDPRWLMEFLNEETPAEICNYLQGLIRIEDMLARVQFP